MPRRAVLLVHSYYLCDTRARRHGAALAEAGWEVDVICARDRGEPHSERMGSVHIRRLPTRRRGGSPARRIFEYAAFALMGFFAVTSRWLRRRHRLIYVLGMPNFLVFCALVPRIARKRVLLDMRDPFPEFFLAKYEASDRHPLMRVLLLEERLSARFASEVVTVGPSLRELFSRSISSERITVVYNGADPKLFHPRDTSRRDPDNRTLLYVGSVTYPYGVDIAVQAVARLCDQIPAIGMRIVGDGDLLPAIREIVRTEGLADRVQIDPQVPLDRVPPILDEVWMGVQPNRPSLLMTHSLSTKILEWCHVGLPVVAGKTGPLLDIFANDEILFCEPGDLDGLCERILKAHVNNEELNSRAHRARRALDRIRFEDQIETFLRSAEGA